MQEVDFIEMLSGIHGSTPFAADAEIIPREYGFELVTMDSFSEQEDFLGGLPPEQMGRQMAYGACADILACGTVPECLVQSWNIDNTHDLEFYRRVAVGIQQVLDYYGAKCIGGDMGTAPCWNWTATVIGRAKTPVTRKAARRVDFDLYVTNCLGEANLAVFLEKCLPSAAMRDPVPAQSLFSTDTSGGFMDALENFRRVNQGMQLDIDVEKVLSPKVKAECPLGMNPYGTLIGGVGEYELLFALPSGMPVPGVVKIGHGGFADVTENRFCLHWCGLQEIMRTPPPDYRAIPKEKWLEATYGYWKSMFG